MMHGERGHSMATAFAARRIISLAGMAMQFKWQMRQRGLQLHCEQRGLRKVIRRLMMGKGRHGSVHRYSEGRAEVGAGIDRNGSLHNGSFVNNAQGRLGAGAIFSAEIHALWIVTSLPNRRYATLSPRREINICGQGERQRRLARAQEIVVRLRCRRRRCCSLLYSHRSGMHGMEALSTEISGGVKLPGTSMNIWIHPTVQISAIFFRYLMAVKAHFCR
jgi:hypothetical protein